MIITYNFRHAFQEVKCNWLLYILMIFCPGIVFAMEWVNSSLCILCEGRATGDLRQWAWIARTQYTAHHQ